MLIRLVSRRISGYHLDCVHRTHPCITFTKDSKLQLITCLVHDTLINQDVTSQRMLTVLERCTIAKSLCHIFGLEMGHKPNNARDPFQV